MENHQKPATFETIELREGVSGSFRFFDPETTIGSVLDSIIEYRKHTLICWKDWRLAGSNNFYSLHQSQIPSTELIILNHPAGYTLNMMLEALYDLYGEPVWIRREFKHYLSENNHSEKEIAEAVKCTIGSGKAFTLVQFEAIILKYLISHKIRCSACQEVQALFTEGAYEVMKHSEIQCLNCFILS